MHRLKTPLMTSGMLLVLLAAIALGNAVMIGPSFEGDRDQQLTALENQVDLQATGVNSPLSMLMVGNAVGRRGGGFASRVPTSIAVP